MVCLVYLLCHKYFTVPWVAPKHILVMGVTYLGIGAFIMAGMILSRFADDMMARKQSFLLFGDKTIWRVWQYPALFCLLIGVYKWNDPGIIICSGLFFFGLKCLITNHNELVDSYNQEELKKRARQENVEKVTL